MPWNAVFSGVYGLYFYVILLAMSLFPWLLVIALLAAAPLAVLLLFILPAGALWAALGRVLPRWLSRLTAAGCLASMVFAVVYGGFMAFVAVLDVEAVPLDWFLLWRVAVLGAGFGATWRTWRWLRAAPRSG